MNENLSSRLVLRSNEEIHECYITEKPVSWYKCFLATGYTNTTDILEFSLSLSEYVSLVFIHCNDIIRKCII